MRYSALFILAAVVLATSVPSYASIMPHREESVRIEIVPEAGSPFLHIPYRQSRIGGTSVVRSYLEARKGKSYGIVVRNLTPSRIGVVIAVDGRNIISGKQSTLKQSEEMYIIDPYGSAQLDGWRTAQDTVHKFYFTDTGDSYSIKTFGDSSAMGVIAVAAYREKQPYRLLHKQAKPGQAPSAPSASGRMDKSRAESARDENAGTGFGEAQFSPTTTVAFTPEAVPFQKTLVKYEWRQTLCRKGLVRCGSEQQNRLWDEGSYAPFPPGY